MAEALVGLGVRRAAVVTGCDGLDEVTLAGPDARPLGRGPGDPRRDLGARRLRPARPRPADLRVAGPDDERRPDPPAFAGEPGPVRDVVLANAAAALLVAGRVGDLGEGVERGGRRPIDSGEAARLLDRLARLSRSAG